MLRKRQWNRPFCLLIMATVFMSGCAAAPAKMEVKDKLPATGTDYRISLNIEPVFKSSGAKGDVAITNIKENTCYLEVVYYLKDTKAEIYHTGIMPPGSQIATDTLDTKLKKGSYPAIASTRICDEDGQELSSPVDTDIVVTVQH